LDAMICTMWPLNASFPKGGWEDCQKRKNVGNGTFAHEFESRILHKAETAAPSGVAVFGLDATVCTMWPLNASFPKGGWEDCQKRKKRGQRNVCPRVRISYPPQTRNSSPIGGCCFWFGCDDLHDVPPASEGARAERRSKERSSQTKKATLESAAINSFSSIISDC